MKSTNANVTRGLAHRSMISVCDNSGAQMVRVVSVKRSKTVKRRKPSAGVADLIQVTVRKGIKEMRKQVFFAIIVRQKKEYRRPDGMRIKFADNAVIILKDEKGNPKGTLIKGPVAKEVVNRWPTIAKIASIVV